ncbi:hypothetical protein AcW1_009014 [Taiwanofungus camphoratus]|nr:hypothetical protein AcW1_009014 [Antrodia cinnamomea]
MDQSSGCLPHEDPFQPLGVMADSLHFPSASHYVTPTFFTQPHAPGHMHVVAPPPRQDTTTQRKRPKYTRSKTGCLTCRAKKIKCDESKPNCMRCTHGQRECTWPEGVPARKKSTPRREPTMEPGFEARPSTAGSSGLSEASTPETRDHTPPIMVPKREPVEVGLGPQVSRRHSEPVLQLPPAGSDANGGRRQSSAHGYPMHSSSNTHVLPAIPEMSTSYSTQYHHSYSGGSHHYGQHQPLVLSRGGSHHGQTHSLRPVAPSSTDHWSSPPLLTPVDPIEPFFPTVQERNLIRHYCDNALSIIMAFPSENPVLASNLQFVLSRTRGSDSAVESLRMALLGTAAIHQSFLLSRSGVCHGQGGADEVMQLANTFRAKSKQLLVTTCSTSEGARSDAALGAAVAIVLIDIFSGGQNWFKVLNLAKTLVNMRGGPAVLLARSVEAKSGALTGVSRARLLLEIIAVYEIFACLANGQEPTLLSPNAKSWWLERANSGDLHSYVEKVFGMSREFIPLLARITAFLARAAGNQPKIKEYSENFGSPDSDDVDEARALYTLLDNLSHHQENLPERVLSGDRIYQNAAQIALLRDVLNLPPDDTLVQQHSDIVLALCADCARNGMGVDLNWPVIIAGSQTYGADRIRVLSLFEAFRAQCS